MTTTRIALTTITFLSLFLGLTNASHAYQVTAEAFKIYINSNGTVRSPTLEEQIANFDQAEAMRFERCMANRGEYWWCSKRRVIDQQPASYSSGYTNGEPRSWYLPLEAYIDHKHVYGHDQYTKVEGGVGASVHQVCPDGFVLVGEGPRDNNTVWCQRTFEQSCRAGNPIDVFSGVKEEHEIDYESANGLLRVERHYLDQYTGWVTHTDNRIKLINAGESAKTFGLFSENSPSSCTSPTEIKYSQYKATFEEPTAVTSYHLTQCPVLINRGPQPVIYAWIAGQPYRFIKNGTRFLPEGRAQGQLQIEAATTSEVPGAAWKLTHRNGDISYLNASGLAIKKQLVDGTYVDYHYQGGNLTKRPTTLVDR